MLCTTDSALTTTTSSQDVACAHSGAKLRCKKLAQAVSLLMACSPFTLAVLPNIANAAPNASVVNIIERSNQSPATMCFTLNKRQTVVNDVNNLQKFLSLKLDGKEVTHSASLDNGLLCLSNLKHGGAYELTLKKGLALSKGVSLNEDVQVPFAISNANAQIRLPYNIILPKNGANSSFVINTVNQPSFKLAIYKINNKSLNELALNNLLSNELSSFYLIELMRNHASLVFERVYQLKEDENSYTILSDSQQNKSSSDAVVNQTNQDNQASPNSQNVLALTSSYKLPKTALNQTIATNIELKDFVSDADDGMYIVVAGDSRVDTSDIYNFYNFNSQGLALSSKLLMITDLGLSTYKSPEGILVNVRSLTTAKTMEGVKLSLIARNNEVLATAITDSTGTARFNEEVISGKLALSPVAIIARTDKDVYNLDLRSTPLYLEDNVGTSNNNDYLAYGFLDRGIYREGEELHFNALVRNNQLQAVNLPLTIQILNPNNNELVKKLVDKPIAGSYSLDYTIPAGSKHGRYTILVKLGDKVLSQNSFKVGSYVPTQITNSIISNDTFIQADTAYKLRSLAKFNYGGNASNLSGEFEVVLSPDYEPLTSHAGKGSIKDFHFGPDQRNLDDLIKRENFYSLRTDVEGILQQDIKLASQPYPQKATIKSVVYDTNGQAVASSKNFKLSYNRPLVGIKEVASVDQNSSQKNFAFCSYLQDGSTFPQEVEYFVYKEFVDYNYIYENSAWEYVRFVSRNLVSQGKIKVDNQDLDKALLSLNLADGSYVIELKSDKSNTSYAFNQGFSLSPSPTTPDRIAVFSDKDRYNVGDKAKLSFESPFDGYANLAVGNRGVDSFKTFEVKKGKNEIEIEISKDYHPQGHVLISIFSPLDTNKVGSLRAVGLTDLNLDLGEHLLTVYTNIPQEVKPNSTLHIDLSTLAKHQNIAEASVTVGNDDTALPQKQKTQALNSKTYAQVFVVDNGILNLTGHKGPRPNQTFMQKRKYDVSLYDAYGFLMTNPKQQGQGYGASDEALMGAFKGDSASSLDFIPQKTVTLASPIIELDKEGKASVDFQLPQFSGSLRVMSLVWNDNQVGSNSYNVAVRDNAVATIGLPRYLNEGDLLNARLNLHNIKAKDSKFKVDITCTGAIQCSTQKMLSLKPGIREDSYFTIQANSLTNPLLNSNLSKEELNQKNVDDAFASENNIGYINLKVINKNYTLNDSYKILVTPTQLPMLKNYMAYVQPNEVTKLNLVGAFNDIDGVMIAKSKLPNVNPEAYVQSINSQGSYYLGDLVANLESKLLYGDKLVQEQETSSEQAQTLEQRPYRTQAELNNAIQEDINRIVAQQRHNGVFDYREEYLNVYAIDVLLQASDLGFNINTDTIDRSLNYLRTIMNNVANGAGTYASAVLARYESINQSTLRFAVDENRVFAPIYLAHLANALFEIGDERRANLAVDKAIARLLSWQKLEEQLQELRKESLKGKDNRNQIYKLQAEIARYNSVGNTSLLHDSFVVIDSCLRLNQADKVIGLINKLAILQDSPSYLSQMTMSSMLRANHKIQASEQDDLGVTVLSKAAIANIMLAKAKTTQQKASSADSKDSVTKSSAPTKAPQPKATTENKTDGTSLLTDSSSSATLDKKFAYTQNEQGELLIANQGKSPIFVTSSVLGMFKHDNVVSNQGFTLNINYFNKSNAVDLAKYQFNLNEEILMEVNFKDMTLANSDVILKVKIPAGFEFVRLAQSNDPSFNKLLNGVDSLNPASLQQADDLVVAKYDSVEFNKSASLFMVLRAAHPGVFNQGEALIQLENSPQFYGSYTGTQTLKVQADK